jgi:hypothetical protein
MKFSIMDATGHTTEQYAEAEVSHAMERFAALLAEGRTAAVRKEGSREYSVTRTFDPSAEETLFIPRLKGG